MKALTIPAILSLFALTLAATARAAVIDHARAVNVTPSGFTLIWQTEGPATPQVEIFSDADGQLSLEGEVGVDFFPMITGDPNLSEGYDRRLDKQALRDLAAQAGLMSARVTGCLPGVSYFYRVGVVAGPDDSAVFPTDTPLPEVTTATENSFVAHSHQLLLTLSDPDPRGWWVVLSHAGSAHGLGAVTGDGAGPNQVLFNLNDLMALDGNGNLDSPGEQNFTVVVYRPAIAQSEPLVFNAVLSPDFSVVDITRGDVGATGDTVTISGRVLYHQSAKPVSGATVELAGPLATRSVQTDELGAFSFEAPANVNYRLKAARVFDEPYSQGVTTFDILLLRAHILNTLPLESPVAILAGDVQYSDSATTLDILFMRRVILGIADYYRLDSQTQEPYPMWRFVPPSAAFADPLNPWPGFVEYRDYGALSASIANQNFTAVKLGDINASWTPFTGSLPGLIETDAPAIQKQSRSSGVGVARLSVGGVTASEGGEARVPVYISGVDRLTSLQFTLDWNPDQLQLAGVTGFELPFTQSDNFGLAHSENGALSFSWDDPAIQGVDASSPIKVFELAFRVTATDGSRVEVGLSSSPTSFEASDLAAITGTAFDPGTVVVAGASEETTGSGLAYSADSGFSLRIETQIGTTYALEATEDLAHPVWRPVDLAIGNGSALRLIDRDPNAKQRFYRITIR